MYFPIHTPSFVFSFLGTILNTGMHNVEGGYENDCSVARLAYNRYMLMSPSIQQMRSFTWVKHHLPEDGSVFLQVFSIEHILIPHIYHFGAFHQLFYPKYIFRMSLLCSQPFASWDRNLPT